MSEGVCKLCGEELDSYSPCPCQVLSPKPPSTFGGMRGMRTRQLARKAAEKKAAQAKETV